ncbi:hypothetical protein [Sanguibacter antarcticus]|uniref:Uncharacterized protein n=1 Tax=Sanguibacter antarcticus TaxID=372484 RepID=A0A2A9E0F5_9MICO|nr:hypothetical protein [Sanguibacter antarcticus]PFG32527.1 hypothetical protein ATL42_0367 [Sanguibacter antarcticus]
MILSARRPIGVSLALALCAGVLAGFQLLVAPVAHSAAVTDFDPGYIISDAVMYDTGTMSSSSVQTFLDAKGAYCSPASGSTCIKSYRETTPSRTADSLCPRSYAGASNESAASIIYKVSVACGINPQVLLVTLQKEQGLITSTAGKTSYTYSRALGFGCPDNVGGWCDPTYAGFANQVYSAAKQLKRYAANPTSYSYRASRTNTVQYHPNTACGTSGVYIENQATASLYNYTPYRPNAAALAAGYGSGDSCSSYGNRNFHLYFSAWFGGPVNRTPVGVIDSVTSDAGTGTVSVRGWALDPDTTASINVHVYVDGVAVRATKASTSRPDVGAVYGLGNAHGFDTTITTSTGTHTVCAYALDSTSGNSSLGCTTVSVTNLTPKGTLDSATGTPGGIAVRGWAFDPDTSEAIDVHMYVDGKSVKSVKASSSRSDVGRAYGVSSNHGFSATVPASDGKHTVCAYAINVPSGGNPLIGCKTVTVTNLPPKGNIDAVTSPAPGSVKVRGWVFDPDSSDAVSVHVYVDGKRTSIITANSPRSDVARAYGVGSSHGFDATIPVTRGDHSVCFYAIDTSRGANPYLGCRTVTVANSLPTGAVSSAEGVPAMVGGGGTAAQGSSLKVVGWASDFDTTAKVDVWLQVDGVTQSAVQTTTEVAGAGTTGFTLTAPVSQGDHQACVLARDPDTRDVVELGCNDVEVPNTAATGVVDSITTGSGTVSVRGWAFDLDTTSAVDVHVYVGSSLVGSVKADASRTDVDKAYGVGANHGFSKTFAASKGTAQVCLYVIGSPRGTGNPTLGCETVTVS